MTFEYAASYPAIAEEALSARKKSLKGCFSLLHGQNEREIINNGVFIKASPVKNGYEWGIEESPQVKQLMKSRAREIADRWPSGLLEKFIEFHSLQCDEPGYVVEASQAYDSEGNEIIEMWDEQKGKAISVITETKEYKSWIKIKKWL